jgi:peroxiredoxin
MAQLRQDHAQFVARNAEVLVVWPDDAKTVRDYCQKEKLPFPNLIDPGHEVASRYGQEVNLFKLGRMPTMAVLDRDGVVRFEHHANGMQDIPANSKILTLLDELNQEWTGASIPA